MDCDQQSSLTKAKVFVKDACDIATSYFGVILVASLVALVHAKTRTERARADAIRNGDYPEGYAEGYRKGFHDGQDYEQDRAA